MIRRTRTGILGMALWSAALLAPGSLQADSNTFTVADLKLQSASELVDVCTVDSSNPDYVAAMAFCYGFFEGAIRYSEAVAGPDPRSNLVCPPAGATRVQAVKAFVDYAKANPQYANEQPVDTIYRALMPHWPCPTAP